MKSDKKSFRAVFYTIALVLVAAMGFTGAYAWNVHQASQENNMQSRTVKIEIEEVFPDKTVTPGVTKIKQVSFNNTGTAGAFLRVAYAEWWYSMPTTRPPETTITPTEPPTSTTRINYAGGNNAVRGLGFSQKANVRSLSSDETGVTKNWTSSWTNDWVDGGDGWYYYKKVLPAGTSTDRILDSVTFPDSSPTSSSYSLVFQVESVQVSDEAAVNADATKKLFNKTAVVSNAVIKNGAVVSGDVSWS